MCIDDCEPEATRGHVVFTCCQIFTKSDLHAANRANVAVFSDLFGPRMRILASMRPEQYDAVAVTPPLIIELPLT
jgi:hypothetical protein